ncbi:recombinase family protein [uncultured Sphingomonas sp.]|uniref:recombinase family protein n=1 Tax=uncultured Sphingomonas sp. TaxID=158754 RepID=UPI0025DA38E6|nr:recombinase family protein [uncultured Sphingomonas sp.]
MPRCAIYARFSTDRQSATSAEDQIADCTARANREGWEIAGVYTDVALSGANNRRPGMTQMLADAAAGSFDIVLSEALDRIARNQADIATIYQRLEFANVAIETLSEGKVSELHIGLKGTMSALFLKDLADKIRRGQRGAVSRGRVPGGLTYGYDVVHQLDGKGELDRGLRRINPEQAAVVRRIYAEYLAGNSPKAICHGLNRDGIPSPRGGEWRASTLSGNRERGIGVLRNPVYAGRYLYNRVHMKRDPDSRKRVSRGNASADRVMVEMPELRIVSDADWQRAQDQAEQLGQHLLGERKRPRYLLTGLLRCGACGGSMIVIGAGRVGCTRHREAGTCHVKKTIRRDELERRVLGGITEQLLAPAAVSRLVQQYHAEATARQSDRKQDAAEIDRKIAKVDAGMKRLVAAIADGAADFPEIREALAARRAERDVLMREKQEIQAAPIIALNPRIADAYRKRVRTLASHLNAEGENRREIIERLRDLIAGVTLMPLHNGEWGIEVLTSLGGAVALATTPRTHTTAGFYQSVHMVAEEGLEPPTPGL